MGDSSSPEITSSRCIMEHVTATVDYKMTNYLQLKGRGVGSSVSSPIFRVGGYDWEIRFYPDGRRSDCAGNVSCYLAYLGQAKDVSVKFTLSMVRTNSQELVTSYNIIEHLFNPRTDASWGYPKFEYRSKLKSMSRLGGDGCFTFTIRSVLTVRNESPPMELPGHLERMLGDGRGADVTFSVGGEEFRAHRCLLAARSPIFAAQLFGPMAEKDLRRVEVVDMEPTIFETMLRYIYTDSLPHDGGGGYDAPVMQHLLVAADRYALDRLKQICEEELCKRMDAETVTTTLALANQHQCERLKETCVEFMASTKVMAAVVETEEFKEHLKTCSPPLSLEESPKEKRQPWNYFLRSRQQTIQKNCSTTSLEITSSRCITEHLTATVDYKMTNYLQLKGRGVGNSVSSPVFRVGGTDWKIRFYPDGRNSDNVGKASCYLCYLGQAHDMSAMFMLSMVETNSQEHVTSRGMADHFLFKPSPGTSQWGYPKFVDRSKLKSMSRVGDGCFTIRCVLFVRNESSPMELPGHLERMLGDGRGADLTFSVGGEEFRAHSGLLAARSPTFAAQLFGPMAEKDLRQRVEVIDMEPTIFEMMLHYIYTDSMPPCNDDGGGYSAPAMQHLLVAADRYALNRLKQMCEKELCKKMDAETVTTTLGLANRHRCEQLKKSCVAFMGSADVMAAVVETDEFKEHLKTCSSPLSLEGSHKEKRLL